MAVKGLQEVLNSIKKYDLDIQKEIKADVNFFATLIEKEAIQLAPGPGDNLKTTYGSQKNSLGIKGLIDKEFVNNNFTGIVFINASGPAGKLAIYVEFGTGASAAAYVPTLPAEFQAYAQQFYVNGKGTLLKQPYLLPSFFKYQAQFLKAVKKTLEGKGIKTVLIP